MQITSHLETSQIVTATRLLSILEFNLKWDTFFEELKWDTFYWSIACVLILVYQIWKCPLFLSVCILILETRTLGRTNLLY